MKKITMCIGNQAGLIGLLTIKSLGNEILGVVVYNLELKEICHKLKIPIFNSIHDISEDYGKFSDMVKKSDILLSVHGREIVPLNMILSTIYAINVHPCLSQYKGANPIERLIQDNNSHASVGAHFMTLQVDEGPVIYEEFKDVVADSVVSVYNQLYTTYVNVIIETLTKIEREELLL